MPSSLYMHLSIILRFLVNSVPSVLLSKASLTNYIQKSASVVAHCECRSDEDKPTKIVAALEGAAWVFKKELRDESEACITDIDADANCTLYTSYHAATTVLVDSYMIHD